jgi:uncharacterized RDD family membrane protein YckC
MGCPQCHNDEISPSGKCLVCGHQIVEDNSVPKSESEEKDSSTYSSMIEMDYSEGEQAPSQAEGMPQWRKDLSQRLQEIRQKKEAMGADATLAGKKTASLPVSPNMAPSQPAPRPTSFVEKPPARKAVQKPRTPPPRQKTLQPLDQSSNASVPPTKGTDPQDVQRLIDNAVSRQSASDLPKTPPAPFSKISGSMLESLANRDDKLILLSRTLSGLVDLICVVLFTGVFIIAADFFSGIIVLDSISLIDIAALFLLTYFVYSLFFLGSSGQTIGMMITDLRVIGANGVRPGLHQLLSRCGLYLVSFFAMGIGLLWSLFNPESLCLHDKISGTRVKRV